MIVRLAIRSLAVRPVRTALLACGFGLGIAVMAELLGIGEVILDQARSPALRGGGDLVISGPFGTIDSARFMLNSVLGAPDVGRRIAAISPSTKATLYLLKPGMTMSVVAHGGVPSREKAVHDPEVEGQAAWNDAAGDARWSKPDPADLLRAMDRFHPRPDVPEFASSWAEWLYFNGRTADLRVHFYLTFLVARSKRPGGSVGVVRLQLERSGRLATFSSVAEIDERTVIGNAPDLDIGQNQIRLEGLRYRIRLLLQQEGRSGAAVAGELTLDAQPGRSLPPAVVRGARGWLSGYVVPVLSGPVHGSLKVGSDDGRVISLDDAIGYHDHNWGFWEEVRWQWGQVAHDELSFVYGRLFPPESVADPNRMPGFLGVLGPDGLLGVSTDVSITEHGSITAPQEILVTARGSALDLSLRLFINDSIRTRLAMTQSTGSSMDFLQLAGMYHVTGRVGGRSVDFTTRGAAETFRPR